MKGRYYKSRYTETSYRVQEGLGIRLGGRARARDKDRS